MSGHFASTQITGLNVSACDNGTCANYATRYDHGRITRSARPPVQQMALIDNEMYVLCVKGVCSVLALVDGC